MLLSNCDDAFGFPPYASLERLLLAVAEGDLRTAEREIIASAARRGAGAPLAERDARLGEPHPGCGRDMCARRM